MGGWENMKTWEKVLTRTDGARKCSRESSDVVNRCQPYANRFVPAKKMSQMEVLDIVAPHEAVKKALKHKIHFADSLCWCYVIIATRQASQDKILPFFQVLARLNWMWFLPPRMLPWIHSHSSSMEHPTRIFMPFITHLSLEDDVKGAQWNLSSRKLRAHADKFS